MASKSPVVSSHSLVYRFRFISGGSHREINDYQLPVYLYYCLYLHLVFSPAPKMKLKYLILFLFLSLTIDSQNTGAVAKFSFNNGSDYDEISRQKVILKGVRFTRDRFGNEDYAVFILGHNYSYLNLGSNPKLKPAAGTISLWIKMENEIWAGTGRIVNPIILTRNNTFIQEDFYEAYAIGYYPDTKRIATTCTKDSTKQINIISTEPFELLTWHHLVMAYNRDHLSFYIDGKHEQTLEKNFVTTFDPADSVLVGITASNKNSRFLNASVDDIEFYDRVLNPEEIKELYKAPNPNQFKVILFHGLAIIGIIIGVLAFYFLTRYQSTLRLKKEKAQLELDNKLLETELRVNRALMNPHFVFNSLNALQHFILQKEIPQANNYLVKFSKLIRRILESNMSSTISLEVEVELIHRYLEIENMRFEENISYSIELEENIVPSTIYIPVMMIQPFIENAIWHGLLKKRGEKILVVSFALIDGKYLECCIKDNGIGRQKPGVDLEKKSLATTFIAQRLDLLNRLHSLNSRLVIEDNAPGGTTVKILLPILDK